MSKLNLKNELNPEQLLAVTTIEGPLLIIAGAGSGKTRVITYRIANMLERGIAQHAILALTFTNKAAREMEARVKELTGKKLQSLTLSTFHAFGANLLRKEIQALGWRTNFSIYDEGDKGQLIRECFRDCKINPEGMDIGAVIQLFSQVKTGQRAAADLDPYQGVYEEYERTKKIYNAVDFDDLLTLPIALFEQFPELHTKYHERFRYILIDEFQDTSAIQYQLMKMLALGCAGTPASVNICAVGDDDQSIYSWRGANYENIVNFEKDFPGGKEIKLEQNYRSTTTILEAANGVIAHNSARKDKKLWSGNGGGKPVFYYTPENEAEEAQFIAERIRSLRMSDKLRYDDFGVLLRTNSLSTSIEEVFLAENIPYRVSGGTSFFARQEIKDVLSYLRIIANTDDDVNLLRIINTPRRGIGKTTIAHLSETARKKNSSLWKALNELRYVQNALFEMKDRDEVDSFMGLIEKQREAFLGKRKDGELSAKVRALVDAIDYWPHLIAEHRKNDAVARYKFMNIERLIEGIETWEQNPDNFDPTLYPYLNRISLLTRDESDDEGKGKVNLMTIHASKGLEFPVVFIAGAEDGIIPHERSVEEDTQGAGIEEERRLFYVAITRARDKLFITGALKRKRGKTLIDCSPSPFISEIPPELLEFYTETEDDTMSMDDFFTMTKARFG